MNRRYAALALAVVALATVAWLLVNRWGLTFTVTFDDSNALEAGDFVYYHDTRIGEVGTVTSGRPTSVEVRIARQYAKALHSDVSFFVERQGLFNSDRRLVAYDCMSTSGRPINRGAVLKGSESAMSWAACKAANAWPLVGAAASLVSNLAPDGSARVIAEAVRRFSESSRRMGREQWEAFTREQLPLLRKQAEAYREQLEKDGRFEDARKFWDEFTTWVKEVVQPR